MSLVQELTISVSSAAKYKEMLGRGAPSSSRRVAQRARPGAIRSMQIPRPTQGPARSEEPARGVGRARERSPSGEPEGVPLQRRRRVAAEGRTRDESAFPETAEPAAAAVVEASVGDGVPVPLEDFPVAAAEVTPAVPVPSVVLAPTNTTWGEEAYAAEFRSFLSAVEGLARPVFASLQSARDEKIRAHDHLRLRMSVLEKVKADYKSLEEKVTALSQEREKLAEERDRAVMSLSLTEPRLEEALEKLGVEVHKNEILSTNLSSANNARLELQREVDEAKAELLHLRQSQGDLKSQNVDLTNDCSSLKAKLEQVESSLADSLAREENLVALQEVNYHGAWNNAILQLKRDNPDALLDLSKLNRYDDWVKYLGADPMAGADEDWLKERRAPSEAGSPIGEELSTEVVGGGDAADPVVNPLPSPEATSGGAVPAAPSVAFEQPYPPPEGEDGAVVVE